MLTQCTSSITTSPTPIARERADERLLAEPLGRGVEDPRVPGGDRPQPRGRFVRLERRVDERRGARDARGKLVDLVLHQRDQRREDERRRWSQHRGELVGERLARRPSASPRACRHFRRPPGPRPPDPDGSRRSRTAPVVPGGDRSPERVYGWGRRASVPTSCRVQRARISSMNATARGYASSRFGSFCSPWPSSS